MTTRRREPKPSPEATNAAPPDRLEVEQAIEAVIAAVLPRGRPGASANGSVKGNGEIRKRPAAGHKPARKRGE